MLHSVGMHFGVLAAIVAVILAAWPAMAQDAGKSASGGSSMLGSSDPVRRAKALAKAGDARVDLLRSELRKGDYEKAYSVFGEYRDDVSGAFSALEASGRDAARRPDGFKQLQIHLRQSLAKLQPMILAIPAEYRDSFDRIRREIEEIDKRLIELLFPPPAGGRSSKSRS